MPRPTTSVCIAASLDGSLKTVEGPGEDSGFHAFFGALDALAIGRYVRNHPDDRSFLTLSGSVPLSSVEPWFDTGLVELRDLVRERA